MSRNQASVRAMLARNNGRIRLLEAHDAESIEVVRRSVSSDGHQRFHGVWMSGLTQTTLLGLPDTELLSPLERCYSTAGVDNACTFPPQRPLCAAFDADSGGASGEVPMLLAALAAKGVSMVIIEDKRVAERGAKVNSLSDASGSQALAAVGDFARVLRRFRAAAAAAGSARDMLITARIESFTVRTPKADAADEQKSVRAALEEALKRARAYCRAGAGAIMIHSKSSSAGEVLSFLRRFRIEQPHTILVVVPTAYGAATEDELHRAGANVVIYANHLLRAKMYAMHEWERASPSPSRGAGALIDDVVAAASLRVRNYACMLRTLQLHDVDAAAKQYARAAGSYARDNMAAVARMLLDGQRAGAADTRLISVRDLLHINAQQVSAPADFVIPSDAPDTAADDQRPVAARL